MRVLLPSIGMLAVAGTAARAEDEACRSVQVELAPAAGLQLVAWIEDAAGNYVDTAFITQTTGLRGLGNRPGLMDIRSGPRWPYGVRLSVLPVWAHRHGFEFPAVVWQPGSDTPDTQPTSLDLRLDVPFDYSSHDPYYNRPMQRVEPAWDAGTAPSVNVFTDKGRFSSVATRRYPPRADLTQVPVSDSSAVSGFATMNPFDAVSQATPAGGPFELVWRVPTDLPGGDYVLRIEAAKEFDFNAAYGETRYPPPAMPWLEYGVPYRGQPSVVYDVPFTLGTSITRTATAAYAGYGDPDGDTGTVFAPDGTITDDTPGSGAQRLALTADGFRVRVTALTSLDPAPPAAAAISGIAVTASSAEIAFVAPGDDGITGIVTSYEVRYRIGSTISESDFAAATPYSGTVTPVAAGQTQVLVLDGLAAHTPYAVAVRAVDDCGRRGPLIVAAFVTERGDGEVGACGGCASTEPGLALVLLALVRWRRRVGTRSSLGPEGSRECRTAGIASVGAHPRTRPR